MHPFNYVVHGYDRDRGIAKPPRFYGVARVYWNQDKVLYWPQPFAAIRRHGAFAWWSFLKWLAMHGLLATQEGCVYQWRDFPLALWNLFWWGDSRGGSYVEGPKRWT